MTSPGRNIPTPSCSPPRWTDPKLPREARLEAALAAIRDHTPHHEYQNTYCPACLAAVALDPKQVYGAES